MTTGGYEVRVSHRAARDLEALPESVAAACVEFLFGDLARNPQRVSKPLYGPLEGYRAARRGVYRIVFSVDENHRTLRVARIDHRRYVYRP
ncbi:MAG: type II toxin-antitoxin system RelE/ParE family toxin [Pseudonocardiaceae bacterium]|nr:type II toxin-antitoxin system RelE/ParE family toxin [Pseudonocardiaceae bacterium]